ncbi:MAG TPA: isocitrate/isopropylmalate dehydrogenase family protein [Candidatus Acidoferrales bacterium]|nr:isocitrate/isopropylmalate dehydrogenase family protein [Candidatus Acidoferrales bacterium]
MTRSVAWIKGDGTGPELTDATLKILKAVDTGVRFVDCPAGFEWWETHGGPSLIPDSSWKIIDSADACLKGPTTTPAGPNTPRSVAVSIRQRKNLYANIRPVKTFEGTKRPLGDLELVCVREATEGLYSGLEHRLSNDVAIAFRKITRIPSEKLAKTAFEEAKRRGWKRTFAITKQNILKETDGLFMEAANSVHKTYPDISLDEYFIDNFAQQLIKNPQRFNQSVIFGTNLFMDIISEEVSGLVASIGCIYSANLGDNYAMFEPAHGSAPQYKGMDKVNPTATVLAAAWMIDYLGEQKKADAIFKATRSVIAEGRKVTYDLGGTARLSEMAEAIAEKAKQNL